MTPRERIIATFNHEIPDRTPTDGWFHAEVEKRLKAHYQTDDWNAVLLELGIEGWTNLSPRITFPNYETRITERPGPESGKKAVWLDERTYQTPWGVTHRIGEAGWYEEWIDGPLTRAQTVSDIENCDLPTPDQICDPDNYAERVTQMKADGLFVRGGIANPYKTAWELRGMENVLADYLINREMLEALYDRLYALYTAMTIRMAAAGVDMITITGDIAMQDRIIMGPDTWRAVDKPRMAKLVSDTRAVNPDVYFYIHSDGNVTDLVDDIIEIGFDILNPLQPECIDPVEVKKRWGDKLTLHGGISLQRTLPFGTPDDVRAEVEDLIKKCGYNGGLVVFPSNVIQPDTSVENIITCFHTARDFDVASLGGQPG